MTAPMQGIGDRWLLGERLEGIALMHNQTVRVLAGAHEGDAGTVVLLLRTSPEPVYLVALHSGAGTVRVRQSDVQPSV